MTKWKTDDEALEESRSTVVLETDKGKIAAGSAKQGLERAQRDAARRLGAEPAKNDPMAHAVITALKHADRLGAKPEAIGASRAFCRACREEIERRGGLITGPNTAVFP